VRSTSRSAWPTVDGWKFSCGWCLRTCCSWSSIQPRSVGAASFENPKGITASSPRLRGTSYLGSIRQIGNNANGVATNVARDGWKRNGRNRVAVGNHSRMLTQGSSCLATLGFGTESRWDSERGSATRSGCAKENAFGMTDDDLKVGWAAAHRAALRKISRLDAAAGGARMPWQ
jgi:hypothetical protein